MAFDRNEAADVAFGHRPVLLDECMEGLNIRPDGIYLDGTLGRAGHSWEIVRRLDGREAVSSAWTGTRPPWRLPAAAWPRI